MNNHILRLITIAFTLCFTINKTKCDTFYAPYCKVIETDSYYIISYQTITEGKHTIELNPDNNSNETIKYIIDESFLNKWRPLIVLEKSQFMNKKVILKSYLTSQPKIHKISILKLNKKPTTTRKD